MFSSRGRGCRILPGHFQPASGCAVVFPRPSGLPLETHQNKPLKGKNNTQQSYSGQGRRVPAAAPAAAAGENFQRQRETGLGGKRGWAGSGIGDPGCIAGVRQLAPRVNDSSSKGRGTGSRCPFPWGTVGDPRGTSRPREGSGDQADPPGHPRPAPHAAPVSWQGWGRRFPSGHLESRNPHAVQRAGASSLSAGSRSGVLLPPCPRATPQLGGAGVRRLGKRREPPGSADPARHALPSRRGRMLPPGSCLAHHFTARGGLFVAAERDRAGMETGAASWVCAEASFWPLKC